MPEGDALARAAQRLQALVGERVEVEAPHPRAAIKHIAERLDGRTLESVEAVGKNLFLTFDGGVVLRSHLRLKGRWWVQPRGEVVRGRPWLVLRSPTHEALLWHGPVLEIGDGARRRLGPDILTGDLSGVRLHGVLGTALQDQSQVAGIGNMWMNEACWHVRVSPWSRAENVDAQQVLAHARALMRARLAGKSTRHSVYRRKNRPCPRCGTLVRSWPLGEHARMAYWCPACQKGEGPSAQ
ncbi:MAG: DNA-formamidopyrimidine glycosylase family protein [Gaiellaceae bacterium]